VTTDELDAALSRKKGNGTYHANSDKNDKLSISRRDFMGIATWTIAGLISLGMGIPAIAYIIGPALKRVERQEWIRLGAASKVELGVPTLFKTGQAPWRFGGSLHDPSYLSWRL